jgi:hypothetical protein
MQRPVLPFEIWLHQYALAALWLMLLLRVGLPLLVYKQQWLLHSQLLAALLLSALAITSALFVPRAYGLSLNGLIGLCCWAAALSFIPRYFWPTAPRPLWQFALAIVYLLAALLLRTIYLRRWTIRLRGHGWAWMLEWAEERSLYARLLAWRIMRLLGWREGAEGQG